MAEIFKDLREVKKDVRTEVTNIDPKDELKDYSGPFKPDLRYSDFSKEALVKLYQLADEYYVNTCMAFLEWVAEKHDIETMATLLNYVWNQKQADSWMALWPRMGITGKDVESWLKIWQLTVDWVTGYFDVTFELLSPNRGRATCHKCIGTVAVEEGEWVDPSFMKSMCEADAKLIQNWTKHFNPNMTATPLFLSPRKSKDDPCCLWEFTT